MSALSGLAKLTAVDRAVYGIATVAFLAACGAIALHAFMNPMIARGEDLRKQVEVIKPEDVTFENAKWDFDKWQMTLSSKPALWKELIEAPPPPPPPEAPPPKIEELVKGVTASRVTMGGKAKIMKPGEARGAFMAVGDTINGCVIKEINKKEVIFGMTYKGKELEPYSIPRN